MKGRNGEEVKGGGGEGGNKDGREEVKGEGRE